MLAMRAARHDPSLRSLTRVFSCRLVRRSNQKLPARRGLRHRNARADDGFVLCRRCRFDDRILARPVAGPPVSSTLASGVRFSDGGMGRIMRRSDCRGSRGPSLGWPSRHPGPNGRDRCGVRVCPPLKLRVASFAGRLWKGLLPTALLRLASAPFSLARIAAI